MAITAQYKAATVRARIDHELATLVRHRRDAATKLDPERYAVITAKINRLLDTRNHHCPKPCPPAPPA